jgi:Mrp family chromosome partitioning ATPase
LKKKGKLLYTHHDMYLATSSTSSWPWAWQELFIPGRARLSAASSAQLTPPLAMSSFQALARALLAPSKMAAAALAEQRRPQDMAYGGNLNSVAFYAHKGGVGKSTLIFDTAYRLATLHNRNVVIVDADSQLNTSFQLLKRAGVLVLN